MGCATGIVKFVLFLFNFIFVVGGILMVTAGALTLTGYKTYEDVVELDAYKAPPILLIVVGSAVFLIAFMGCCGVLRESNCMMMTYAVFLTVILLVQVGVAVAAALHEKEFKEVLQKGLVKSIEKYDNTKAVQDTWDSTQSNFKCCGANDYNDWTKDRTAGIPESCCKKSGSGCSADTSNVYAEGCVEKVLGDLKLKYVVYAAAVIGGVELFAVLFACCLAARFRRKNYA